MILRLDQVRTGMAHFVVLFAVFILSIILIALWTEFFSELRQTSKMQDDTHHVYLAEAVLAKGINMVKKKPWMERFYVKDARCPSSSRRRSRPGSTGRPRTSSRSRT